jgi:uncharacterized protein (DUF2062 family)
MFTSVRPRPAWKRVKNAFWPDMGFARLVIYYRYRFGRLPGTSRYIAAGIATGIAVSFTPFMGFHILLGAIICWILRASILGMTIGTVIGGNPWTLPVIWVVTYKLGHAMMGTHIKDVPAVFNFSLLIDNPVGVLLPMAVGCIPFVLLAWPASYYFFRGIVRKYKRAERTETLGKHA